MVRMFHIDFHSLGFLSKDFLIHGFQSTGNYRYIVYRSTTTAINFSSLVSSCIGTRLLFLQVILH